jgi:hypothetical protein
MKHKTLRYRRNLTRLGYKSIGRKSIGRKSKRNSIRRTKNTKRLHRRHTRRYIYKMRGYKMRGGEVVVKQAPMPPAVFTPAPQIVAGNPADGIKAIEAQRAQQNMANRMGGGNGNKKKQRGGTATICGGAPVNGGDGYGYTPPNNCLLVPTINNQAAQMHAINTMDTLNTLKANAAGDNLVGVLPK